MPTLAEYLEQIPDEFAKLEATIKEVFKTGQEGELTDARVAGWIKEMESGGVDSREGLTGKELEDQLRDDIAKHVITKEVFMEFYGVDAETAEGLIVGANEGGINFSDLGSGVDETGGAGGAPGTGLEGLRILRGKEMDWFRDPSTGKWYIRYGMPGSDRGFVFEVEQDQLDALFGEGNGPPTFEDTSFQGLIGQEDNLFGGNVGEMEGDGSFEEEVNKVITLGLENGALPEWAIESGEVLDLLYISQAENKSNTWLVNQIATTDSFNARFPGIEVLKTDGNLTWTEAVSGFLEFEAGVRAATGAIGEDASTVTPEIVGGLLEAGHALTTIQKVTTNFKRMQDYAPAMAAFNEVLVSQGLPPITTLNEMYQFVAGEAPSAVYDVWEASSLTEAASAAGLGDLFGAAEAMEFAVASEGAASLQQSMTMFQSLSQTLLRFRNEIDLGEFGLNQEDILDMSLGQPPRSGVSAAELQANMSRAVSRAQANLRTKGGLFKSFTQDGRPQASGLSSLRPDA